MCKTTTSWSTLLHIGFQFARQPPWACCYPPKIMLRVVYWCHVAPCRVYHSQGLHCAVREGAMDGLCGPLFDLLPAGLDDQRLVYCYIRYAEREGRWDGVE